MNISKFLHGTVGARSDLGFDGCTLALSSLGGEYDGDMAVCGAVDNWKPERDLYNRERDQNWSGE